MPPNQPVASGSTHGHLVRRITPKIILMVIGIVIVAFGCGYGASYALSAFMASKKDTTLKILQENSLNTAQLEVPAELPETGTLKEYTDVDTGVSFRYPEAWGAVSRHMAGDADRAFYTAPDALSTMDYTFSNVPLVLMPIIGGQNSYLVNQSACFLSLGFLSATLDQTKIERPYATDWQQSKIGNGNHFATYSKTSEISKDRIIIMSYAISTTVSKQGYCNGLSVYGEQQLANNSNNVQAVQFIWSETAKNFGENQKPLDVPDLELFKANPKQSFSDADLNGLRALLTSLSVKP